MKTYYIIAGMVVLFIVANSLGIFSRIFSLKNSEVKYSSNNTSYKLKDNSYYYDDIKLNADVKTFSIINGSFAKDKNSVFCKEFEIPGIDVKTLKIYGNNYIGDKNNIFYESYLCDGAKKVENVDRNTFTPEKTGNARDMQSGINVPVTDYAKDKNHMYLMGKLIQDADPDTFEHLGSYFDKDKNHAYTFGKLIPGADVKTFQIVSDDEAKDKNRSYTAGITN